MKYNRIIIILIMLFALSVFVLLSVYTAGAISTTYTFDYPVGTFGTSSDGKVSPGGGYIVSDGTLKTTGTGWKDPGGIWINTWYAQGTIEFDIKFNSLPNAANYIYLGGNGFDAVQIGSANNFGNYPMSNFNTGQWYRIRLDYWDANNTLMLYVNNTYKSTFSSAITSPSTLSMSHPAGTPNLEIDNLYISDVVGPQTPPTINTTFNGYVKDANGNALEYCNVSVWSGNAYGTYMTSDLTDANGYYTFGPSTLDIGGLYNISVKPPNSYYTNLYGFTANATTPLTLNFTVNPARMQIYAYDASKGISTGDLNAVNFTIYASGGGLPGTITYVRIGHDSPYIFDENIPTGANVCILANKTGFVDKWYNFTTVSGWNTPAIAMSGDYSSGGYVLIAGHTRDNIGTTITGIPLYLVRADTGAVVSTATSSNNLLVNPGYYALQVPISAVDYGYKITGNFPGYGNLTCDLRDAGAQTEIGTNDVITYDDTWVSEGLSPNAEMGVDAWFSLAGTYTPSATPTPSPGGNIPSAPSGYNIIGGQVYNVATGQNIASVPVYFCYQNGTLISSTTTDASGAYSFTFATAGMGGQSLIVKPGNTAQFLNTTSTTYISYPFTGGATSFRNDIGMTAVAGYQTYKMSGYLYDAVKGENYRVSGGTVSIWTQDGNTQISIVSVNGGGYYEIYLGQDLTPATYLVSAASVGYTNNNGTFPFPGAFAGDGMYNLSLAMQPTIISDDNNNALGIQITDNTTGLILNNAQYVIKYADNNTVYASGGMGGQYVVYLYNLPAEDYLITGSYTGYTSLTYGKTITANNWYSINIGLNPIITATPIPTVTPTPTGTPAMYTNPLEALIHLLVLAGLDEATAKLFVGFILIIGGAVAMALTGAKIGLVGNVGMPMLIAIGAASGFALACLMNVWPIWLLLVGAFLVVIYVVYAFVAPKGG